MVDEIFSFDPDTGVEIQSLSVPRGLWRGLGLQRPSPAAGIDLFGRVFASFDPPGTPYHPDTPWNPVPWKRRHRLYLANNADEVIYVGNLVEP